MSEPRRIPHPALTLTRAQAAALTERLAPVAPPPANAADVCQQRARLMVELRAALTAATTRRAQATVPSAWVHADGEMTGLKRALEIVEGTDR